MIEKVKAINNPLTIIAIFAALAEVAGTVALKLVSDDLQTTFIWFVMLFPVLLVLLFFITLNFNPKVLYAPSDFRNEENFLSTISGVSRLSIDLGEVQRQLEVAKSQILEEATKSISIASENERKKLVQIVETRINAIQSKVETTKESVEEVALQATSDKRWFTMIDRVLEILKQEGRGMTVREIIDKIGTENVRPETIRRYISMLTDRGDLIRVSSGKGFSYYMLNDRTPDATNRKDIG